MNWRERIEHHYQRVWKTVGQPCKFSAGPIHELPPDFTILAFPPHESREMWTYATCCMSNPEDPAPIELHLFSENACDELVELLVVTAHFHRTGAPLNLWHTVNFGKPWQNQSACNHGLISLPYLDGPELENLQVDLSTIIKFYWLIPVTSAEVDFKKQCGVEALEQEFERQGFNYLDPRRHSVI